MNTKVDDTAKIKTPQERFSAATEILGIPSGDFAPEFLLSELELIAARYPAALNALDEARIRLQGAILATILVHLI